MFESLLLVIRAPNCVKIQGQRAGPVHHDRNWKFQDKTHSPSSVFQFDDCACASLRLTKTLDSKRVTWNETVCFRIIPSVQDAEKRDLWWSHQDFQAAKRLEMWRHLMGDMDAFCIDDNECPMR